MNRTSQPKSNKRIIILGFDGLSPDIVEPLMQNGKLPNLSRLKESGSYRRLATTSPAQSPVAWSGFSTGRNPAKNGIFDFIVRDPSNYRLRLSLSDVRAGRPRRVIKGKCFWNYTSEVKFPAVIMHCPLTFPADKIYGRMLSGMGVTDCLGTEGTFTFFTTEPFDPNQTDVGGKVFHIARAPQMVLYLIGPRLALLGSKADNVKVPLRVTLQEDRDSVTIECQGNTFELKQGQWSDWHDVTFRLGLFKRMKGIYRFYLVEVNPEFKLYISPIHLDPRKPFFPISYPQNYSRELAEAIGLYNTLGTPIDTWAVNEKRLTEENLLEQAENVLKEKEKMLELELKRFKEGVFFFYFGTTDTIQHMFWRHIDIAHPRYDAEEAKKYQRVIEDYYIRMDAIVGEVMQSLKDGDTFIVLSDHGFNTFRRAAHLNSWLRQNHYLYLKDDAKESGGELLSDIDWNRTRAYAISFGAIYINQKGRERYGIVEPGEATESLKDEISRRLLDWRDEKYNAPVIRHVYKREEIFKGRYIDQGPDLYVGFNVGYRASWRTALGAVPKELVSDNLKNWSGDHLFDPGLVPGVIFSNREITKKDPSIYDVAPTILKIAGFSDERLCSMDLDGTALF